MFNFRISQVYKIYLSPVDVSWPRSVPPVQSKLNRKLNPALVLAVGYAVDETSGLLMILSKKARRVSALLIA